MIVIVHASTHGSIVVVPLCSVDGPVSVGISEVAEELQKHLFLRHLTTLHLWMKFGVVDSSQILNVDTPTPIFVELQERLVHHSLSLLVWTSSDSDQELIEVDETILVCVQERDQRLDLVDGPTLHSSLVIWTPISDSPTRNS